MLLINIYRSALIFRNLPYPEKFLVTRLSCNFFLLPLTLRFTILFAEFVVVPSFMDGKDIGSDSSLLLPAKKVLSNN